MVHRTIYTMGFLPAMAITSANVQDSDAAMGMRDLVEAKFHGVGVVVVDAGYAGQHARSISFKQGVDVRVVRHSGNRNAATWVDNQRWPPLIEVHGRGFQVLLKGWKIERTYDCNDRPRCLSKVHDRNLAVSERRVCLVEGRQRLRRITSVTQRA